MRGMHTSTKEAGDYFANEGTNLVKAVALIIGTPLTNMMGNIFFKICKQKVPLKLFPNEKKAIDWLKLYL
jgi:hypothetical protein